MNPRTQQILEAAVQEFIETGEPVSSGWLYKQYDFGIKPAMIRLELDALEEAGYLEQPYHSAGRIPTDAAYEFYAARIMGGGTGVGAAGGAGLGASGARTEIQRSTPVSHATAQLSALLHRKALADLMGELSSELKLLSVAADLARDMVYKSGLEKLVENLDWEDRAQLHSVIHDFEAVDGRMLDAAEKMGSGPPQVFIGKKSPVTKSDNLSVVGGNYAVGDGTISIFVIGPKRMDYKKVIKVFKNL
jgi:transcriptional regulator of heat shock response